MLYYSQFSDILFIVLEFFYFLLTLAYILSSKRLILLAIYPIAAIKFGLSSFYSFDMFNYQKVYDMVDTVSLEPVMYQEGTFASLLYISKSAGIPLPVIHGLSIIGFLLATQFLFEAFLPPYQAITISLILGSFAGMGELGLYLLRQLISTSIVFVGLGLLFRNKNIWAWLFFGISFLFHSSSFAYFPIFITSFFPGKYTKFMAMFLAYILLILIVVNEEWMSFFLNTLTGENSLYIEKYQEYEKTKDLVGWRDDQIGLISIFMILYFVVINFWKKAWFWKSPAWLYYCFSMLITAFQLILEKSKFFWISSRFNFMSDIFVLTISILITAEIIPPKEYKFWLILVSSLLLLLSIQKILVGYEQQGLFHIFF